jgi:hypothetical protein
MPLSSDPDARAKQLANLKTSAAVTHGAQSGALIQARRDELLAELVAEFPSESRRVLLVQAHRLAVAERAMAYADAHGILRHARTGEVFAVVALGEQQVRAYLNEDARIRERQQARGGSGTDLQTYLEATYGDQQGGGDA